MEMQKFVDLYDKITLAERALLFLGGLDDLERGYRLVLTRSRKEKYYLSSIGNYHFCVFDYETSDEVEDWGYCDKDKLRASLSDFVKEHGIREISIE